MPAVATAQAERTVAPEDIDAYVAEFHQDPVTPPVVDGVGGISDAELAEYHDLVRATQDAGDPETELVPGEMWSDTVGLPAGVDKTDADAAEIAIATEQHTLPTITTLDALDARMMAPASTHCKTFFFSPHQVCGAILARYEALGGQFGWLMHPVEPMNLNPDGQGYRQRFHNGFIYWHPNTGAHAVTVRNADVWARNGWEQGWLGYPLGGEVPVKGTTPADGELNGWVQLFQGGRMYRTPLAQGPQVASINGAILDKWLDTGGVDGPLGFPIADEARTADSIGRFSIFQWGSLYWSPNTGAHALYGPILQKWTEHGYENGTYGYPTSDITGEADGREHQEFERGIIDIPAFTPTESPYNAYRDNKVVSENYDDMIECIGGYDNGRLTYFHMTGENLYCKDFRHINDRHMPPNLNQTDWKDFQTCVAHTLLSSEPWDPGHLGTYGRTRYNTHTKTRIFVVVWSGTKNIRTAFTDNDGKNWGGCRYGLIG